MSEPYAQLTYTSFDPPDGGVGGWQVKDLSPDVTDDERARALQHVIGTMTLVVPMSRFPSEDEIASLPRRMQLHVADGDLSGLIVHSTPAGPDASGRQGNVFNHVVFDRTMASRLDGPAPVRAIQLWRSPGWLTPYGVEAVREARPDDRPPQPVEHYLTREAVAGWLCDPGARRPAGLASLLDALEQWREADQPRDVVLVADDVDEGAWWLAAAALLASPQSDTLLTFCTYERVEDVLGRETRSVVTVVLRADGPEALHHAAQVVVVDPAAPPAAPRTAWGVLAEAACSLGPELLADRLLAVEELSELNPDAAQACPWWPLAVAVSEEESLRQHWRTAAEVVLEQTPADAVLDEETRAQLVLLLDAASGDTAADAWELLARLEDSSRVSVDLLAGVYGAYLNRLLDDVPAFLSGPPAPVLVLTGGRRADLLAGVAPVVQQQLTVLTQLALDPVDRAVLVLRWLDLGRRVGLVFRPDALPEFSGLLDDVAALLLTPDGERVVELAGPLHPSSAELLLPPLDRLLQDTTLPPGERLAPDVTQALHEALLSRATSQERDDRPLTQEALLHACRSPEHAPGLRVDAARLQLSHPGLRAGGSARDRVSSALSAVGGGAPWSALELRVLVDELAGRPELELDFSADACRALLGEGPGEASAALADAVLVAQRDLDPHDEDVLLLFQALMPGWEDEGVEHSARSAMIAEIGCRLAEATDRVDPEDLERLAPSVLAAAARSAVWTATGRSLAADDVRAALDAQADVLLGLLPGAGRAAGKVLGDGLPSLPELAADLFQVTVQVLAGVAPPSSPPADLLIDDCDGETIADAALRTHLTWHDQPRRWVDAQLHQLPPIPPASRDTVMNWAFGLLTRPARREPLRTPAPTTERP